MNDVIQHKDDEPACGPLLLTARQAAQSLAISDRTLWTLTKTGRIAAVRFGASVRYDPADLRAFIEASRRKSPESACTP